MRSYHKIPYKSEYNMLAIGSFEVQFDLYRDDLTNVVEIFSRAQADMPSLPHFYFTSSGDAISVYVVDVGYIAYGGIISAGEWNKNIKVSYNNGEWKLYKDDIEIASTGSSGGTNMPISDDSELNSYFVNARPPSPDTECNFLLQNLKIYSSYIPPPASDFKWLKYPTEEGWANDMIYIGGPSSDWAMNFQDYSTGSPITSWKWEVNNLIDSGWVEFSTNQNPRNIDIKGLVGTGYVIEFGTWNYKIKLTINGSIEAELDLYILWDAF